MGAKGAQTSHITKSSVRLGDVMVVFKGAITYKSEIIAFSIKDGSQYVVSCEKARYVGQAKGENGGRQSGAKIISSRDSMHVPTRIIVCL